MRPHSITRTFISRNYKIWNLIKVRENLRSPAPLDSCECKLKEWFYAYLISTIISWAGTYILETQGSIVRLLGQCEGGTL